MKKLLTILLTTFMLMTTFTARVFAEAQKIGSSNTTWELSNNNTLLTIGGTGDMPDLDTGDWPWNSNRSSITSVVIGDGITNVGKNSMRGFTKLVNVSLPSSLETIGEHAFFDCSLLSSITIPNNVTTIDDYAFQLCSNLNNVKIPSKVTNIGFGAFYQCSKLITVICEATTPPKIDSDAFGECDANLKILVPATSVEVYKTNWSEYANIIEEIPLTIADILPDDFPLCVDVLPFNTWDNDNGIHMMLIQNTLGLITDESQDFVIAEDIGSAALTRSGNNFIFTNNGVTTTFVMSGNTLVSVEVSGLDDEYDSFNGTYAAEMSVVIDDEEAGTIASVAKDANGMNLSGISGGTILLLEPKGNSTNKVVEVHYTKADGGNGYAETRFSINQGYEFIGLSYSLDGTNYINITSYTEEHEETGENCIRITDINGCFKLKVLTNKIVTITDVLAMSKDPFPTSQFSGWIIDGDTNNYRAYSDGTNLKVAYGTVSLSSVLEKDGDNYKITSGGPTYIFKIESNILESINYSVMGSGSGEYIPYKYEIEQTTPITKGSTSDLVFKTNGVYTNDTDVEVKLNNQLLDLGTHYTVEHGSIIVTLLGDYIKTLAPNTYTISIGVPGSFDPITSQFTITGSSPTPTPTPTPNPGYVPPKTGVDGTYSNNHSLLKLSSLSLLAIGTYMVIKKKKDN